MIKVLFICHGNICRSPMAEFIFKNLVKNDSRFCISSAATSTEEIWNGKGNPVYPPAKRELLKHNIDPKGKTARQVIKKDYQDYDYLICMDHNNIRNLKRIIGEDIQHKVSLLLDYTDYKGKDIEDPWYTGDFQLVYEEIELACKGLLDYINNNNS